MQRRFSLNALRNNAPTCHLFYTNFDWEEIEAITKALKKAMNDEEAFPNGFDSPDYGGLPKSIYNRLTSAQVDYLCVEFPHNAKETALVLARGQC